VIYVALSTFAEYDDSAVELLRSAKIPFTTNRLGRRLKREEVVEFGAGFAGIVAGVEPYDAGVLEALPGLRCISRCGVGVDNIDLVAARRTAVAVRNTPAAVIQPTAELALAMILGLARNLAFHTDSIRGGGWSKRVGVLLGGRTAGIIGTGRIGRRVAEMLCALDVAVLGADLRPDLDWAARHGVSMVTTEELLARSDIVTLHVADVPGQPFRMGPEAFRAMKDGAFLVNVARGQFLDEAALLEALDSQKLAGAALDVYSDEPYRGPLAGLDNVILTPHVATLTRESRARMELEAVRNVLSALSEG